MTHRAGDIVCSMSLRVDKVGGPVKASIDEGQLDDVRAALNGGTARGLIVLLHGYNNNYEEASDAYAGFFARQYELATPPEGRSIADNRVFLQVYWPGDADWGIAAALFYMGAIRRAKECAPKLADALEALGNRPEPLEIEVIGHSLGCRVFLEIVRKLGDVPNIVLKRAVFMAAAVPTSMLESPEDVASLRHAYDKAVAHGGAARSLFSSNDAVLSGAFPIGQSLAEGEEGFAPTALGYAFWECPVMPERFSQYEVSGAGHSDYWGWSTEGAHHAIGLDAQTQVRQFFDLSPGAATAPAERLIHARNIAGSRTVASRQPLEEAASG